MKRRDVLKLAGALTVTPAFSVPISVNAQTTNRLLRFASADALEHLDPYYNSTRLGALIAKQVWDTLIYRDPTSGEYQGLLATSWEWIDDLTLELKLRDNVTFHNGDPFNADDVVYTLSYVSAPDSGIMNRELVDWIDRVEKLDDYTVQIICKHVFPPAIEYLVNTGTIYPHKYYKEVGPDGMNKNPIGSGPYKIASQKQGSVIQLEAFEDYFEGGPKTVPSIDNVEIRIIPDPHTQIAEIMAGGLDLIVQPMEPNRAEQISSFPGLDVKSVSTMRALFLLFDSSDETLVPALKDERVRRAISHAIDRETMVKALLGDDAELLDAVCTPTQFGCPEDGIPTYEYNPDKAKALLAEAGYPDGFEVDIFAYRERTLIEAIIVYLRDIGIKANLNYMQYAAFREQWRAGKAPISFQTWASYMINDVSSLTPIFFKNTPDDRANDQEVITLLQKGDTSGDEQTRLDAYKEALSLIQERAYALPLASMPTYFIGNEKLSFEAYFDETPRFWEIEWT